LALLSEQPSYIRRAFNLAVKFPSRKRSPIRAFFLYICRRVTADWAEWWLNTI